MSLSIAQLGQPVLRQRAEEIPSEEIPGEAFQLFIDRMLETVQEAGGVGLAGPQVFAGRRIFLACIEPPDADAETFPMEVFINPEITFRSEDGTLDWEGCLSFSELSVLVPRHEKIRIEYLNRQGESCTQELEGFPARVVQHEFDHLEGVLTLDRAPSTRYIIKSSELEAFRRGMESDRQGESGQENGEGDEA